MPIHDWTRVDAGAWHDFHVGWIALLRTRFNDGLLPDGYYAMAEKRFELGEGDVITLEEASHEIMGDVDDGDGGTAVLARPRLSVEMESSEVSDFEPRGRSIAIRHESGDRLVALLELTSPANKDRLAHVERFVDKAEHSFRRGVHLSVIDLFPPTRHDGPGGLCGAVAEACDFPGYRATEGKPLAIAAIDAGERLKYEVRRPHLYAEPLAIGDALPDLPVFYRSKRFVEVPLQETYDEAFRGTAAPTRRTL
ncbi:MAG: DUF4058 family protein, partial [Planctomycetota bacterium]